MEKKLPTGKEVLIFKYRRDWNVEQDEFEYVKGIIQKSDITAELSSQGRPEYKDFYSVLGEDGRMYFGTYGKGSIGGSVFRTPKDEIAYLKERIKENEEAIKKIEEKNDKYKDLIADLLLQEMEKPNPDFEALGVKSK